MCVGGKKEKKLTHIPTIFRDRETNSSMIMSDKLLEALLYY